jgi:hypothetical protein
VQWSQDPLHWGGGGGREANNIFPLKKKTLVVVVIKQVAHCAIGFALLWHIQISNKNNFLPLLDLDLPIKMYALLLWNMPIHDMHT